VVLLGLALTAAWTGSLGAAWGPLRFSLRRPLLAAEQALALLLLREALVRTPGRGVRARLTVLFAALLAALVLDSGPVVVGDGAEYLAMTRNLAHGRPPALTPEELAEAARPLPSQVDDFRFVTPELQGRGGRQGFYHSWAYSLLAAPLWRLAEALGLPLLLAFSATNALVVLFAFAVVTGRLGPRVALLVLGGAGLWWLDKPHTELVLLAVLCAALALLPTRPAPALLLEGLAGLQNPALAVALAASVLWLARQGRLREGRVRLGLAGAVGLLAAGPLYSLWLMGVPSPLSTTVVTHWPSLAEILAVLVDPNLGLAFAWPAWAAATTVAAALCLADAETRRRHRDAILLLGATALVLLLGVTQPANLNNGGTRSVSRYALWLVPVAIPVLGWYERRFRRAHGLLLALAGWSLWTGLGEYHPRRSERYVDPTPAAERLWRRWPGANNPLPEVFAERSAHYEGEGLVPTATPGCTKALLVGDGTPIGVWPLWCRPAPLPAACAAPGTFCYANRRPDGGYAFARAPRQPSFDGQRFQAWGWGGNPREELVRFLAGLPWSSIRPADPRLRDALFADSRHLGRVRGQISPDVLLVWMLRPRRGAWVSPLPGVGQTAVLIDPLVPEVLQVVPLDPVAPRPIAIPFNWPLLLAVVPDRLVPPGLRPPVDGTGRTVPSEDRAAS
jgi:hypothetical protein